MTNNWVDLDNSSMFFVCGANPAENHPASIAHLNVARFDTNGRGRNAALVVVDPRQTRTARLISSPQMIAAATGNDLRKHDRFVRIRPGTNIAFINGVLDSIIKWMYANPTATESLNFFKWHNTTVAVNSHSFGRIFLDDATNTKRTLDTAKLATAEYSHDGGATWVDAGLATGWPKYCDSRIKVNAAAVAGPQPQIKDDYQRAKLRVSDGAGGYWTFSNMPVFAADVSDSDCVFQKLRNHVAKYDAATVAGICGCTTADIAAVRDAFIASSRFASSDFGAALATITVAGYRAACIMYAMGATQFTTGSQGVRSYAVIQTLMGNMGRAGGGINALRGIHNVQGSTDMGVLFDLIPGYSGNPAVDQTYADYQNKMFGNRVLGTAAKDPYVPANVEWQQRGFYNMTREWFGNRSVTASADFDKLYACWPKANGVQHIEAFRRMDPVWVAAQATPPARISAAVVWGQNPAVTEPNQGAVRKGLEALDLLVCVDMFANETAQCKRKDGGVTYLLPACSHVEEAGSVSSSGRWIQWRDRACSPKGNSKSDLELLLKLSKALNTAGAFSHIKDQWKTMADVPTLYNGGAGADPFTVLYGKYGWDGTGSMEAVTGYAFEDTAGNPSLVGSEYVAEQIFKEMCSPLDGYAAAGPAGFVGGHQGTLWIYSGVNSTQGGAYNPDLTGNVHPAAFELDAAGAVTGTAITWGIANKAKSRKGEPKHAAQSLQYPRYGWAWLLNRRIMYNNGELPGDVGDVFVAPGYLSRLWCIGGTNTLADWSWLYRAYNQLADMPDRGTGTGEVHVHPGRLPAYTEPYESPSKALATTFGYNTAGGTSGNLIFSDSARLDVRTATAEQIAEFPLVLTSIRCVEHFQGGPITRNNPWNVELEPDPWVEINSVDAIKYGIKDGDWVNVETKRGGSVDDQESRTIQSGPLAAKPGWNKGFKARVGAGTLANQRVAPGTVAIPWHWGDRGLGAGARANDLCIDAWDANTRIPEYKACLCKITTIAVTP
jgi:formate dehydrogenase major subunit